MKIFTWQSWQKNRHAWSLVKEHKYALSKECTSHTLLQNSIIVIFSGAVVEL